MFEENPPSRYFTRLAHPEDSQETSTAVSHVLRDQENTGHVPADNSGSFASSGDLPANPTSPQNHLANLKLLMARQKAEYESKIASLEQRNRELQSEIKGMHSKLGQQRKWYSLVEMKMRNAERAKEDAERRNEMLQKEMEEFLKPSGELTNGNKQELAQFEIELNCRRERPHPNFSTYSYFRGEIGNPTVKPRLSIVTGAVDTNSLGFLNSRSSAPPSNARDASSFHCTDLPDTLHAKCRANPHSVPAKRWCVLASLESCTDALNA